MLTGNLGKIWARARIKIKLNEEGSNDKINVFRGLFSQAWRDSNPQPADLEKFQILFCKLQNFTQN